MGKYEELFEKIKKFAEEEDKIKSMVLFGSRARSIKKADDYSDYDIIFFVDDVKYFTEKDEWLKEISDYYISFVEHTAVQDYDVEFSLMTLWIWILFFIMQQMLKE